MLLKRKTKMSFKKTFICLMTVCFLPVLSACSTNPTVLSNQQTIYVGPPDSLLTHPCKATPPGESLIELAIASNKNLSCIAKYKAQIEKIKENKKKQEALYVK